MTRIGSLCLWTATLGIACAAASCEPSFDPSSKLNTLRVLAVRADHPYPTPGTRVQLEMLLHDGKSPPDQPRSIQILWIGGCFNPAGDLYYACYPQLGALLQNAKADPNAAKYLGFGTTFGLDIPADLISRRPARPGEQSYGLSYVFFVACAGTIVPLQVQSSDAMPFACYDAQGNPLGTDDFVPGYLSLYSYNDRTNANPILTGLSINDVSYPDAAPVPDTHVLGCLPDRCPDVPIQAIVDPSSAELDPGATDPRGIPLREQMWVDYYASDGTIAKAAMLVNDATAGWNNDNGTLWTPPEPGKTAYVYAAVHDNRGGVAWMKRRVIAD
jgi:hypothetical protein